jgi:hypothetical protein
MQDIIILSSEEQYRLDILTKIINKNMKSGQGAKLLCISVRQVQRLAKNIRKNGASAVILGLRGKTSNHHIDLTVKANAVVIINEKYPDFGPTFAVEKLGDNHSIYISRETGRQWMIGEKIWKSKKQKQSGYHSWRPRKEYFGELEQFDGSYHYWFENRFVDANNDPIEVCLLASIDDATGKITKAVFAKNEGIFAVFTFWKEYILETGKPLAVYLDEFSTYKINHKAAEDNKDLLTQFQRATRQVKIELIHAQSSQAKGRIERLFLTLQDRLVKEMRLAKINTPEEGNTFLKEVFLPKFNSKFAVVPAKEGNVHRPVLTPEKKNLNRIFSVQSVRTVRNDFTIQFKNSWYKLVNLRSYPTSK